MEEDYILRKILRAFRDYQKEKYKTMYDVNTFHVHELVACKFKSELVREIPELSTPLNPPIFIGEGIDNLMKELFEKDSELQSLTVTTEGVYEKSINVDGVEIKIVGKPDIVLKDTIIEVKYTQFADDLPRDHHIKQLKLYLFLTGYKKGKLVYVTNRGFKEYNIEEPFTEQELVEYIKNWSSPRYEWECTYCNYKQICPHYRNNMGAQEKSVENGESDEDED
ncbi:MAG: CRISPR-associated protein Cas4 [Candidatus Njordarchaeia archaeon]